MASKVHAIAAALDHVCFVYEQVIKQTMSICWLFKICHHIPCLNCNCYKTQSHAITDCLKA